MVNWSRCYFTEKRREGYGWKWSGRKSAFFFFFKKGEIIASRNDLVGKESFMVEEGKDIFRAISLSREEGIMYCVKGRAKNPDGRQRTWGPVDKMMDM